MNAKSCDIFEVNSVESLVEEREKLLRSLDILATAKTKHEIPFPRFIEVYRRYVNTYKKQYPGIRFLEVIDQIKLHPEINTMFWRMFFVQWGRLTYMDKFQLFYRFPVLLESYSWLFHADAKELRIAPTIEYPFVPKAVAIAVTGIATKRFDPSEIRSVTFLYDLVWVDLNFDMRDYERVYRDVDGWGIWHSDCKMPLLVDNIRATAQKKLECLVRCSLSLDTESKISILTNTVDDKEKQKWIKVLIKEAQSAYLLESKKQNTEIADAVDMKATEWNAHFLCEVKTHSINDVFKQYI